MSFRRNREQVREREERRGLVCVSNVILRACPHLVSCVSLTLCRSCWCPSQARPELAVRLVVDGEDPLDDGPPYTNVLSAASSSGSRQNLSVGSSSSSASGSARRASSSSSASRKTQVRPGTGISSGADTTEESVVAQVEPPLVGNFSSHSLSRALGGSASRKSGSGSRGTASRTATHNSSLTSGQADMELVELSVYDGARDDVLLTDDDPRSEDSGSVRSPRAPREWPSVLRDGWRTYLVRSCHEVFLSTKLNFLLLAVPLAIIARLAGLGPGYVFVLSLLGLCPLAERISFVTDEMSLYTNDTVGGLLSATMGNITELIVSFFALRGGLLRVVQLSLVGSILSNLLLVQGSAFLLGGLRFSQQRYSQSAARTNVALLVLAVSGLMFPMVLSASEAFNDVANAESAGTATTANANSTTDVESVSEGISASNLLVLSRFASVLLLLVYGLLILYQLKTHVHLFETREEDIQDEDGGSEADRTRADAAEEEEQEPPVLGPWGSIVWAGIVTVTIAVMSEFIGTTTRAHSRSVRVCLQYLMHCASSLRLMSFPLRPVSAIEGAAGSLHLPVLFSATILLPIVGNAAEHASALIFARRDQMDIALGISVGSSTQIALLVVPLMVVVGWIIDQPLSLDFQPFETVSMLMTVVFTSVVLSTGKSDWLYGAMMIVAYVIIAAAFWLQRQPKEIK